MGAAISSASVRPSAWRSATFSMPATGVTRSKIMARAASMPKRLPPKAKQSSESCAIALFGRFGERLQRLDLGGAELELGDLAERIEGGIRQEIGGRLGIAERDEDHAVGHVRIDADLDLDGAAPRRDLDQVAALQPQPLDIARRQE